MKTSSKPPLKWEYFHTEIDPDSALSLVTSKAVATTDEGEKYWTYRYLVQKILHDGRTGKFLPVNIAIDEEGCEPEDLNLLTLEQDYVGVFERLCSKSKEAILKHHREVPPR